MEIVLVVLQACVVIGAIVLGVRTGGLALGLWGVVGTVVLVFDPAWKARTAARRAAH